MDMIKAEYLEVTFVGICILGIMFGYIVWIQRDSDHSLYRRFLLMLLSNMFILAADAAIYLLRYHTSAPAVAFTHISCIIFYILSPYIIYIWLQFVIIRLHPGHRFSRRRRLELSIPWLFNAVVVLTSPWTHLVYRLSDNNHYIRGPYFWFSFAVACIYWILSIFYVIHEMRHPQYMRERSLYRTLLFFPIPTLIGNVIQIHFYGISTVWIFCALSLLVVFIGLQSNQISRDMLTGLFNRKQTSIQLDWELRKLNSANYKLFVVMIDVNKFKQINDRCGHIVGDQALIAVADTLRATFREQDFIARYGGDEFIVTGHVSSEQELLAILQKLHEKAAEYNKTVTNYDFSLSAGYTLYDKTDSPNMDTLVSEADENMYIQKQKNR